MINPMSLQDRNILVTGAAQGIGRATALLAAELGARVVLADVNGDGVEDLARELGSERALEQYPTGRNRSGSVRSDKIALDINK